MAEEQKKQVTVEIVPPHPTDYLRAVNANLTRVLLNQTEASFNIPTLLDRAKTFVNKERYITLTYVKQDS